MNVSRLSQCSAQCPNAVSTLSRRLVLGSPRSSSTNDRYLVIRRFFNSQSSVFAPKPGFFAQTSRLISSQLTSPTYSSRALHTTRYLRNDIPRTQRSDPVPKHPELPKHDRPQETPTPNSPPHSTDNYSDFFRRLAQSIPHRRPPTKEDFLNAATGFWERFRVRMKWLTIRSFRRFNTDDMSAFVTWFIMSQAVWIFVGTTTFFSAVFAVLNSLRLQNDVARYISDYLSANTGVQIVFESAIVPKWKDSRISFKNVYISRKPAAGLPPPTKPDEHMAAVGYDVSGHPAFHRIHEDEEAFPETEEDLNYSMFDLTIDSVDVTLSLPHMFQGKGLVTDAAVKGVRGVLDRRSVTYDPDNIPDPADFRHPSAPGDFELDSLQLEDVLITVLQPGEFRPFTASIFRADVKTCRKRWLFYDLLNAENIVGQFDNCLMSLHRPQSIGRTTEKDLADGEWSRMSRLRIDGVNIDHVQRATGDEGPISWIRSGQVDLVLDIKFPRETEDGLDFNEFIEDLADAISTSISSGTTDPLAARIPGQRELLRPPLSVPDEGESEHKAASEPKVVVDVDLRFRDIKADLPIFTRDISYVNNALARPIVAFMNANKTLVPIRCRIVKNISDFDGAWTMWETGLLDEMSVKIYEALAYHVSQANINRRLRTVGFWSLQMTAQAVLNALRNAVEPMRLVSLKNQMQMMS